MRFAFFIRFVIMKNLLLLGTLFSSFLFGQEVISFQGDSYSNTSGSIDFTIGEVIITTASDGNNDLTQGFHQTNWNFVGLDYQNPDFEISVYPNPIDNELNIETDAFENMNYVIYDAVGKIVLQSKLTGAKTQIKSRHLLPASYTLVVQNQNQEKVKTFKLIKTQ